MASLINLFPIMWWLQNIYKPYGAYTGPLLQTFCQATVVPQCRHHFHNEIQTNEFVKSTIVIWFNTGQVWQIGPWWRHTALQNLASSLASVIYCSSTTLVHALKVSLIMSCDTHLLAIALEVLMKSAFRMYLNLPISTTSPGANELTTF